MLKCNRCDGRVFVDRQYTTAEHIETACITCGHRKFYHPPSATKEGQWILQKEKSRAKHTITNL
jgi:predicted  nucleic acid-binding Zn-ribbon protein